MRIGIVTIFDKRPNYGNKLQNYATLKVLTDMGNRVETLVSEPPRSDKYLIKLKIMIKKCLVGRLAKIPAEWGKAEAFWKFDKKYLRPSYRLLKGKSLDRYNYFCIGSDQVWNPTWYGGENSIKKEAFLLTFAKPEQKICMAPSIGLDKLPEEWVSYFSEQWQTFPYLSVREKSGAKIIKELTGRDAQVIIDPTLMLGASDWRRIAKKSKARTLGKKYILSYFLGAQDEDNIGYIKSIADKHNFEVLELMDEDNIDLFSSGPSEFIDLVDNAELICTDSFHACVFSILFNKPFLVFDRNGKAKNIGSRISGLLTMLKLEDRLPGHVEETNIFKHDYVEAYKQLEIERKKSYSFLKMSLNID